MPSWAIHFRVADYFLDKIDGLNKEYFIVGNIAPDCGVPVNGQYNPSTRVTHLTVNDISNKSDCNYDYIYNHFIKEETDINKKSFYIGYFVHLYTDCRNAIYNCFPIEEKYGKFVENRNLSIAVKKEWHNIDCKFLKNNTSPSFELFKTLLGFSENYPSWYKNNEISWQMKNIVSFYRDIKIENIDYKYTGPEAMDNFVSKVSMEIYNVLIQKSVF